MFLWNVTKPLRESEVWVDVAVIYIDKKLVSNNLHLKSSKFAKSNLDLVTYHETANGPDIAREDELVMPYTD